METRSNKSSRSGSSFHSSTSSTNALFHARAKAAAAKVRAEYAEQEAKARIEKVKKETEIETLAICREAAEAEAVAAVWESAVTGRKKCIVLDETNATEQSKLERTSEYIQTHFHSTNPVQQTTTYATLSYSPNNPFVSHHQPPVFLYESTNNVEFTDFDLDYSPPAAKHSVSQNPFTREGPRVIPKSLTSQISDLNIEAPSFNPQPKNTQSMLATEHLAQYLARRDLVNTSLYEFDDKPENYRAWLSSYKNATQGLGLTATEELDLMTRWLGKESSNQVKRLRAVHIASPQTALVKAWERLQQCYAAPEVIEKALFTRLDAFPRVSAKENLKLRELSDLLMEVQCAKEDGYLPGLSYLDTTRGIEPIVTKLPYGLQERWVSVGSKYKEENRGRFPPFDYFTKFICYEAKKRNDPSFALLNTTTTSSVRAESAFPKTQKPIAVHKINVTPAEANVSSDPSKICPLHAKPHPLKKCKAFRAETLDDRKVFLKENGICFKCCSSTNHMAKNCTTIVKCFECDSTQHVSAMHPGPAPLPTTPLTSPQHGGEGEAVNDTSEISSSCTAVCGTGQVGRSCSKICLARVYQKDHPDEVIKAYIVLDDHSNRSLAKSSFFDKFDIHTKSYPYQLKTCSGVVETSGRRASDFFVESLNGKVTIPLPPLTECNDLPDNRSEIPTPNAALHQPHLSKVAEHIPELDPTAEILLLLGRDTIRAHKVREQINGPANAPFAQRLDLGWVLVGEVCLGNTHKPNVSSFRTTMVDCHRPSLFQPCTSNLHIKEELHDSTLPPRAKEDSLGQNVFDCTEQDNKLAPSIEDETFLKIMDKEVYRNHLHSWVAPLPFRQPRQQLPNNREQALKRFESLQRQFRRKPEMQKQYLEFMDKLLKNNHAEVAPELREEERWYLPSFAVYHPQKPDQIRVVFDSSAQQSGISLNNVLLTGPDLNNTLLGVLMRFRKDKVAVMADIQQMFYCFLVAERHRNYLRFLWFKDNNVANEVIDYRMKVHVFGNSPSPAVAIYGLRRAIRDGAEKYGADTVNFVERHFYVDDGLCSVPTDAEAIGLLHRTQASLAESNLRLHKFASNSQAVLEAFPSEDCIQAKKEVDLSGDESPTQRSLGLLWEIASDTFTFSVSTDTKPFTRRGVLSMVNSVFDPLGFLAPVTIQGRDLLRDLNSETSEWDTPLPEDKLRKWEAWRNSLQDLRHFHISRMYTGICPTKAERVELHVFSDASVKAIGAVAYLRAIQGDTVDVGFVMAKAKLAPQSDPTIPRLELCAAVLAVEIAERIQDELDLKLDATKFYTDSKVVLGYIYNQSRRFYVYVHNRVLRIRQSTIPEQWHYVNTEDNPADLASRSVPAARLTQTRWFNGPTFLRKLSVQPDLAQSFSLVSPESDAEVRPVVKSYITDLQGKVLSTERFERFSTFDTLQRAIALLIHIARSFKTPTGKCKGWHRCGLPHSVDELSQAREVIIRAVQRNTFVKEFEALERGKQVPLNSCLRSLNPILQADLLRLGGRLKNADVAIEQNNPVILPKEHHVSLLLTRYHHAQVKHQGRHLTEGAVRAAGLWILGGKRLVNSTIHKCITCRRLRGRMQEQQMADLPAERLTTCPPFTYVGLDVFGPWHVSTRRTRGTQPESKCWAILFCCMSSRAVHVEVITSMDTSSCINALRRFFAIRGPAKQLRSDCGTNFIGACKELGLSADQPDSTVQRYLHQQGCSWVFNPPHASHMGGSWERLIGVARRILDSMLRDHSTRLTHEVLCTLMAEVTAILNARPLVPVSNDPENPYILTPSMLLTQKVGVPPPPGDFTDRDLLTKQWRQVQALSNLFWNRWRQAYLSTLQSRKKWTRSHQNLQDGDLVLLKDNQAARNNWPLAVVTKAIPGTDGRVRKVELRTANQGQSKTYLRPVTETVLLLRKD
ncbi:uncharacterized protein LOC121690066 isoform X1 [Alosa sapidissima]|uniref:uncharacterized protein LOC121690066 isoform X1 n=1 Tax=Alosa sapidissima TaxID=34773 RepID=UPI001C093A90|nr:uncharacterized protein LOC121690066 isoform X1 [Alosa sapidissima]